MRRLYKALPMLAATLTAAPLAATAHGVDYYERSGYESRGGSNAYGTHGARGFRTAYYRDPVLEVFDERLERQWRRIQQGVQSGALTRKEARKLTKQHAKLVRLEREFVADGRFTYKERRKLSAKLDGVSDDIRRLKRNDRRRKVPSCNHYRYRGY